MIKLAIQHARGRVVLGWATFSKFHCLLSSLWESACTIPLEDQPVLIVRTGYSMSSSKIYIRIGDLVNNSCNEYMRCRQLL